MPDVYLFHQSPIIRTVLANTRLSNPKNRTQHSASTLVSHSLLITASLTETNKIQMPLPFPVSRFPSPAAPVLGSLATQSVLLRFHFNFN